MTLPQIYHLPGGNNGNKNTNNTWNRDYDHRHRRLSTMFHSGTRRNLFRSASKGRLVFCMAMLFAMSSLMFDGDDYHEINDDDEAITNSGGSSIALPHRSLGASAIFDYLPSDSSSSSSSSSSIPSFLTYQDPPDPEDPPSALASLLHAMSRTPGHPSLSPTYLSSSYLYAPSSQHPLLRAAYQADPLALPSAYTSLLPQSSIAKLKLPTQRAMARTLRPYDDRLVIQTLKSFRQFGFILRFSGKTGHFSIYTHVQNTGLSPRARSIKLSLGPILRHLFPDRFAKGSPDFAVVISGGDSVKLHCDCFTVPFEREDMPQFLWRDIEVLTKKKEEERRKVMEMENKTSLEELSYPLRKGVCNRYEFGPIWQFGSGFVNPEVVPTSVTLPVWSQDLECFRNYVVEKRVCKRFREYDEVANPKGVYFGKHEVEIDVGKELLERHSTGRNGRGNGDGDGDGTDDDGGWKHFAWRGEHNPPPTVPFRPLEEERTSESDHHSDERSPPDRDYIAADHPAPPYARNKHTLRLPVYPHLRPQLMWRGTDFTYLGCFPDSRPYHTGLTPEQVHRLSRDYNSTSDITKETVWEGLNDLFERGTLGPRWRAIVMSLRAEDQALEWNRERLQELFLRQQHGAEFGGSDREEEMEMRYEPILPWLSVKFTDKGNAHFGFGNVQKFERLGIHVGSTHHMNWEEAAGYKYHIDLGGGGGTTWTGVSSKLALPGVLFHHETSTYDWFHEDLLPWIHYIPVSAGLSDLREKYLWAEAHPREAQAIAEAGTAFMRYMGTEEYWERIVERTFVFRLKPYIDAYEPWVEKSRPSTRHPEGDKAFLGLAKKLGYPLRKMV
mmetsp:Transcript_31328/g.66475  ORF Transcript_31328/g.66475 Transcript_31328/m.66475 type:complete len:838 (+) Transcript_31328:137-2650(+)|eukprot:CAMPEP_0171434028 /NCGR_PEP_ID=MMETSP0881-20121228/8915_1 /TAXON_ID=67004 /ORGANISM="Thalassiosira weissflogii, Strain CCMP1336" /LENGTH=837 /DNA_ID=CAMNT_0011954679 /DNA_START=58 /DNA_END=2571 /DNA_ORIENTATION=-